MRPIERQKISPLLSSLFFWMLDYTYGTESQPMESLYEKAVG